jgi:phospholipase C
MTLKEVVSECVQYCRIAVVGVTVVQFALGGVFAPSLQAQETAKTTSPIKHVIIIVGENRTFDHVFATYKPKKGETVDNLLSRKIINADGTPGPNFSQAAQIDADGFARDSDDSSKYSISPEKDNVVYQTLPPPLTGGPSDVCKDNGICTLAQAMASENGLFPTYYQFMLTGGTEQPSHVPDQRIQNVNDLPSGPFQLTSKSFPYDSYAASPVHRFYQMWQQEDCDIKFATSKDPSGCKADLFPWVEVTIGAGTNGKPLPVNFNIRTTGEGSTAMGFYNVQEGDAPYLNYLVNTYSISDNYHQPVMGGTGANSIMLGFGDAIFFSDSNGNAARPPEGVEVFAGTPNAEDLKTGNLPAVSYVKPSGWGDGHPASSKLNLFEGFVKKIVNDLKANEELWESTAIFVTADEGGGYYDAGYVQPLDFFGDGARIPLIVVSPYTSAGHTSHSYADHVSILKFIERNWNLETISKRSRDNLPNPKPTKGNAYVPSNSPAIDDLFDLFDFSRKVEDND